MLEPIQRRVFPEPDRAEVQEIVARAVERDPDFFIERYRGLEQSFQGRYVCSDLFKETFEPYRVSRETRNRYNTPVHNAAAVLASEALRRLIAERDEPERDTVVLITGIPGAGKSSAVLKGGAIPVHVRALYEGQLAKPETALAKVQQVLDGGLKAAIYVIHVQPEWALEQTLRRSDELGRGASIETMASIQGGLAHGLRRVYERCGAAVTLRIVDRRVFHSPKVLDGWEHVSVLESEGDQEHVKARLTAALERGRSSGRIADSAYTQALRLDDRSQEQGLFRAPGGRHEEPGHERSRASQDRQETVLTPPSASAMTAAERLRVRSDEVAARLAAEREQARPAQEKELERQQQLEQEKQQPLDHDKDHGLEP
jgi:hypothetical protein